MPPCQVVQHARTRSFRSACIARSRRFRRSRIPTIEGIKATIAIYNLAEMRKHKAEEFYDASFMEELDKSGFLDRLYQ